MCSHNAEIGWYAVVMATPSFQIAVAVFFAEGKTLQILIIFNFNQTLYVTLNKSSTLVLIRVI